MTEPAQLHVLVIDDDELSREVLTVLLAGEGYCVTAVSSGEEALAQEMPADIVLMDWQMPGLSGEGLARRLREACGPSVRLIAMSGSMLQHLLAGGCDAFLLKPFSMQAFDEALYESSQNQPSNYPHSPVSETDVLDPATFSGFETIMAAEPLRELYRLTLNDASQHIALIQTAWGAADDAGVRKSAHAIKGSLGMVGALELQRLCATLESGGISDAYIATLNEFPAATERLRRMLNARGIDV